MTLPKENPLTPASLAANGIQGAEAKALGPCSSQHTAQVKAMHYLAQVAVDAARKKIHALALVTDEPSPGMVEAADLLDAAAERLARASKRGTA